MPTNFINPLILQHMNNLSLILAFVLMVPMFVQSAEVAPAPEGKHLFILSGQSNMREPLPASFRESVSKVFGKEGVIVVTVARPSQSINQWYKKWTPPEGVNADKVKDVGLLYDSLMSSVKRSIVGQKIASVTFVWMQGEADAESGWGAVYEKSFYGVLDQIKVDLDVKSVNFVLGRINDYWLPRKGIVDGDLVRSIQEKLGDDNANGDWVDTDDLNTGLNPWGIYEVDSGHFPNAAYRIIGQRFARKACKLVDPQAKVDDVWTDEVFIDSADDIKSHLAMAKLIKGTNPDAARAGGSAGLSALLDGKFGVATGKDEAWIGFAPTEKTASFVVDLGETQSVTSVGVDLLFNKELLTGTPGAVSFSTSTDNVEFSPVGKPAIKFFYGPAQVDKWLKDAENGSILILAETAKIDARYVRIEVATQNSWLFVDEIVVNPVAK